jgi:hypothetical protein
MRLVFAWILLVLLNGPLVLSQWLQVDFLINRNRYAEACIQKKIIPVCRGTCQLNYELSLVQWSPETSQGTETPVSERPLHFDFTAFLPLIPDWITQTTALFLVKPESMTPKTFGFVHAPESPPPEVSVA